MTLHVSRNFKAFTLIELLVVVAIIGILAAVGVVAYNGYTGSAKIAATKSNHATIVKFMSSEITKCLLGETSLNLKKSNGSTTTGGNKIQIVTKFSGSNGQWGGNANEVLISNITDER